MTKDGAVTYELLDDVLIRTPLLPLESYRDRSNKSERGDWIEPAIVVASLTLATATPSERTAAPRLRYRIRMATRPTPYGLFSGVSLAQWGEATTATLADTQPLTRTRPDMGWLLRLVMENESRPEVRRALTLRANPAALVRGGRIILSERLTHQGDGGEPQRVSVRATHAARLALQMAREPIPFEDLCETIAAAAPNVSRERIELLVDELIGQSLIITDLRPPLTCDSPGEWLAKRLAQIPAAKETCEQLQSLLREADTWDRSPVETRIPTYRTIAERARKLGAKEKEPAMQVDTVFPLQGDCVNRAVGEELAKAAALMIRLSPLPRGLPYLQAFRQVFVARYGEYRDVPLLEALDPHWGIGPPNYAAHGEWIEFPERDQALWDLACGAIRDRRLSIELDEATIARLETSQHGRAPLPPSIDICAFVCARPGGIDRGEFKVVVGPNVGAASAGRNIGRFAQLLGDAGMRAMARAARIAQAPEALTAELVYLPRKFRLANVAIRPVTHDHEIVVGVSPGVSPSRTIPLDELYVGVAAGAFYLRWPGHAERVEVSTSHMLNYLKAPPALRFLAHLQVDQRVQLHAFDWGAASRLPVLPRVQAGRIVLRPAQWRIDYQTAFKASAFSAFKAMLADWRSKLDLPRHIYLSNGDVRLLLDLDEADHAKQLHVECRRLRPVAYLTLHEALPGLDDAWLPGPGGHFLTEVVASLSLAAPAKAVSVPFVARQCQADARRVIPPGGDWLYFKLYGSSEAEDDLLAGPLSSFVEGRDSSGAQQAFFFLRYSDPDAHLRLRFRTPTPEDAEALTGDLFAFGRSLLDSQMCTRFAIDTYEREIERYGGPHAIGDAEELFSADSALVLRLLNLTKGSDIPREVIAVATSLDLFDGLALREHVAVELASRLKTSWRESGIRYRELKSILWSTIDIGAALSGGLGDPELRSLLDGRRAAAERFGRTVCALSDSGTLASPLADICLSHLHMHFNRFVGRDRKEESRAMGLMVRLDQARAGRKQQTATDAAQR